MSMAEYLKLEGYEVDVEFTGQAGIEAARTTQYSQIILDVALPDVNGIDSMRAIKECWPNVRILLMTGFSTAYLTSINSPGDIEVLTKPLDLDELLKRLDPIS